MVRQTGVTMVMPHVWMISLGKHSVIMEEAGEEGVCISWKSHLEMTANLQMASCNILHCPSPSPRVVFILVIVHHCSLASEMI